MSPKLFERPLRCPEEFAQEVALDGVGKARRTSEVSKKRSQVNTNASSAPRREAERARKKHIGSSIHYSYPGTGAEKPDYGRLINARMKYITSKLASLKKKNFSYVDKVKPDPESIYGSAYDHPYTDWDSPRKPKVPIPSSYDDDVFETAVEARMKHINADLARSNKEHYSYVDKVEPESAFLPSEGSSRREYYPGSERYKDRGSSFYRSARSKCSSDSSWDSFL